MRRAVSSAKTGKRPFPAMIPYFKRVDRFYFGVIRTPAGACLPSCVQPDAHVYTGPMSRSLSESSARSLTTRVRHITASPSNILATCGCLLLFGWACFNWFSLLQRDIRDFVPLPEWDYWETVAHIPKYEALDPSVLWEQRYEHRVVFAETIYAADYLFFHGRQIFPAVVNVVFYAGVLVLLALTLYRARQIPRHVAFAAVCLVAILLAFPGTSYSLSLPILVHFFMSQVAVIGSLWLLARGKLWGAIAGAVVANFSLANGLAIWPILIFFAWRRHESFKRIAILAGAFVLSTATFFIGYRSTGNFNPQRAFSRPMYLAGYFFRYVSMPFGAVSAYDGLLFGICGVLAVVVLFVAAWRKNLLAEPTAIVGFGVCFVALFTMTVTSMSRMPFFSTWQESSVIPGHYLTISLQFWAALAILTVLVLCRTFRSPLPSEIFLSLFAILVAVQQPRMAPWTHFWLKTTASYHFASLALESGLKTPLAYGILYYGDPQLVPRSLPRTGSKTSFDL